LSLVKRSFSLLGHRTSVALEPEFWAVLSERAGQESLSLSALVTLIDTERDPSQSLASALRIFSLQLRI